MNVSEPHSRDAPLARAAVWSGDAGVAPALACPGVALAGRRPGDPRTIVASVLPSLVAAAAVLIDGQRGIEMLIVGFGAFWIYEHRQRARRLPESDLALRRRPTLAVCATLALTLFASDAAGRR